MSAYRSLNTLYAKNAINYKRRELKKKKKGKKRKKNGKKGNEDLYILIEKALHDKFKIYKKSKFRIVLVGGTAMRVKRENNKYFYCLPIWEGADEHSP